jgi:large subunit ribosomal protein L30
MSKIAVVLIRGFIGMNHDIRLTLKSLNLGKKHACVIIEDTPVNQGMLKKVQDYVTYGAVSDETIAALDAKREKHEKGVYFLAPPVGGFERKGIKKSFVVGGALGDRKQMDALLQKMM